MPTLDPRHVVSLANGRFHETTPAQLTQAFDAIPGSPQAGKLVVHFHGGLVPRNAGLDLAHRLTPIYEDAGAYPLFFTWESGLTEVLAHNLPEIAQEKIFRRLLERVLQWAVAKAKQQVGERGAIPELPSDLEVRREVDSAHALDEKPVREPYEAVPARAPAHDAADGLSPAERREFEAQLLADADIRAEAQAIANGLVEGGARSEGTRGATIRGSTGTLMDPRVLQGIRTGTGERGLVSIATIVKAAVSTLARVVLRYARGRDHGVYCTVVEELLRELYVANAGKLVWDLMKKDTLDAFGQDPATFAGRALLAELARAQTAGQAPRVTLVGHSTGAVFINHFLDAAAVALPGMSFDVVLLAPASTFAATARTLRAHEARIAHLRVFGMKDAVECQDRLPAYPRSLLYFVSGVLEGEADMPVLGMERFHVRETYAADPDVRLVRERTAGAAPPRLVWSITDAGAAAGLVSRSRKHGDFDNDPDTLASVARAIAQGF